eukprot:6491968-Amphidinium_carterae.3
MKDRNTMTLSTLTTMTTESTLDTTSMTLRFALRQRVRMRARDNENLRWPCLAQDGKQRLRCR